MPEKCILVAGSANQSCDSTKLARATEFVRATTEKIIETGNSVAVLATREPVRVESTRSVPLSFDWEVLRTIDCHLEQRDYIADYNLAHVFMGSDSMEKRFTPENATLIQRLQAKGAIDIRHIEESLYSGGEYRDRQAECCDAMIAIGGGKGTYQVADKMLSFAKPVMPMDIQLGAQHQSAAGAIQLLDEMKADEKVFLRHSHQVVNQRLYALSLEKPYWNTSRIAHTTVFILTNEMEAQSDDTRGRLHKAKDRLHRVLSKSPQIAQGSFHVSKTAETIERLFD